MENSQKFDLKTLEEIKSFKQKVIYCRENLEYLGKGTARIAFALPDGHVLKMAFNQKGLAQNRKEGGDWYKNGLECFTHVYNASEDDYLWLDVEKASRVRESDFMRYFGIRFSTVCDVIMKETNRINPNAFARRGLKDEKKADEVIQSIWDEDEDKAYYNCLHSLFDYIGNYGADQALVADFLSYRNWGKVTRDNRETLVITDSGLDQEVYDQFYRPKLSF